MKHICLKKGQKKYSDDLEFYLAPTYFNKTFEDFKGSNSYKSPELCNLWLLVESPVSSPVTLKPTNQICLHLSQ